MSDIHALSGAYSVDALDDDERVQFEQHLAECADCRAEVRSFRETAALLAEPETETPPASLRAGVLAGIQQVRPLPPETRRRTRSGVRRSWLPQVLAAAAAVVLLVAGAALWHPWQHHQTTLADQILNAPDAMHVTEKVPGGGELTLVRSASLKRAVMLADDVPDPASGTTYQLWMQQPGQDMVSAGLMPHTDQPTVLSGDAASAVAAAVTVEPAGGSAHPTHTPIAVFALKPASPGSTGPTASTSETTGT